MEDVQVSLNAQVDTQFNESVLSKASVVYVIDDMSTGRELLKMLVESIDPSLTVRAFDNPEYVIEMAEEEVPDLVLTDYRMPQMNGEQFIKAFRQQPGCQEVPILVITIDGHKNTRYKCLEAGASDFIIRPIDEIEARARCLNLLKMRNQQLALRSRADQLEYEIAEATREIRSREKETIFRLARAGEYRDEDTGNHVIRMAKYCRTIAEELGLNKDECEAIEMAAPMHDVGKIGISDTILKKQSGLTLEEANMMHNHTRIGYEILQGSKSEYVQLGADIALYHHERWDGKGYPFGISGDEIPMAARLVAIADVYDALRSKRPYKEKWPMDKTIAYIEGESGKHFDPNCVNAFMLCIDTIQKIEKAFED